MSQQSMNIWEWPDVNRVILGVALGLPPTFFVLFHVLPSLTNSPSLWPRLALERAKPLLPAVSHPLRVSHAHGQE